MKESYKVRVVRTEIQKHYQEASVWIEASSKKEAEKIAIAQAKQGDLDGKFETYDLDALNSTHIKIATTPDYTGPNF